MIIHERDIPKIATDPNQYAGAYMKELILPKDGWDGYVMRQFGVEPNGATPRHQHAHQHIVYILEGTGHVLLGEQEHFIEPGTCIFVPPNEVHTFKNNSDSMLKFICIVPEEGHVTAPCCSI